MLLEQGISLLWLVLIVHQGILLLETKLQWGEWLKWPAVKVDTNTAFGVKCCEVMNMDQCIAKRTIGMGHNPMAHHVPKHMAEHYRWFGVSENVNT